jgi:hypothetical protein
MLRFRVDKASGVWYNRRLIRAGVACAILLSVLLLNPQPGKPGLRHYSMNPAMLVTSPAPRTRKRIRAFEDAGHNVAPRAGINYDIGEGLAGHLVSPSDGSL